MIVWLLGEAEIVKSGVGGAPHPGNLNDAMRVRQLNAPLAGMYSFAYQKVQSSTGSTAIALESPQRLRLLPVWEPAPARIVPSPCDMVPAGSPARRPV